MNEDKALRKIYLARRKKECFPEDLNTRIMKKIDAQQEKKRKRIYLLELTSTIVSSCGLIVLMFYVFRTYMPNFNLIYLLKDIYTQAINSEAIVFFVYIAFIALFLLFMDHYLRNIKRKKQERRKNEEIVL